MGLAARDTFYCSVKCRASAFLKRWWSGGLELFGWWLAWFQATSRIFKPESHRQLLAALGFCNLCCTSWAALALHRSGFEAATCQMVVSRKGGYTLSHHPFLDEIFHYKLIIHLFQGTPMAIMEPHNWTSLDCSVDMWLVRGGWYVAWGEWRVLGRAPQS